MIYTIKKLLHLGNLPYRYDQLFEAVRETRPMHIMEIGVWTGERAKKMIGIAAKFRKSSDLHYYGFDLFETMDEAKFRKELSKQPPTMEEVQEKLNKTGAQVHLYKGDTTETLPRIVDGLPAMDLVFIDGGHSLETIESDWRYVSKTLHAGSVVIFDDYWTDRTDAGAKPTVDAIDRKLFEVSILPTKDFFETTPFGPLEIRLAKVVKR